MRKNLVMLIGATALIGSATIARAGAYGEPARPEESPAPAPPVAMQQQEEEVDYARTGPYLGVGGNYAIQQFDNQGPSGTNGAEGNVSNTGGFHVRAGYRVHPYVAVEALYEYFANFDNDAQHQTYGLNTTDNFSGWSVTANAKGFFLTGRWQPYAVVGLGYMDMNGHNVRTLAAPATNSADPGQGFAMRFGLGMDAYATEHLALGPEVAYVLPFGGADGFDMVTVALGLRYRF